jgi:hypothetical protein
VTTASPTTLTTATALTTRVMTQLASPSTSIRKGTTETTTSACQETTTPLHPTHGLRIRFPEGKCIRRPKQPNQPRGFIGPAGRGSGRSLIALSAVSAVSATLSRPKDSAPRLSSWRLGASAMTRSPRTPQAYSSLGRVVHHRQSIEARDIQAGQRSRRGLQQRLEHRTTTSLLPLKCFKSFMYLGPFTCINKSLTIKGGSALPQQKPTLPRGLEGGNPLCVKIFLEKVFHQNDFCAFQLYR